MRQWAEFVLAVDGDAEMLRQALSDSERPLDDVFREIGHAFGEDMARSRSHATSALRRLVGERPSIESGADEDAYNWQSTRIALIDKGRRAHALELHARAVRTAVGSGLTHRPGIGSSFLPFDDAWWGGFDQALVAAGATLGLSDDCGLCVEWCVDMRPWWKSLDDRVRALKQFEGLKGRSASAAFAWLSIHVLLRAGAAPDRHDWRYLPPPGWVAIAAEINSAGELLAVDPGTIHQKVEALCSAPGASSPRRDAIRFTAVSCHQEPKSPPMNVLVANSLEELLSDLKVRCGETKYGPRLEPPDGLPELDRLVRRPVLTEKITSFMKDRDSGYIVVRAPPRWGLTSLARCLVADGIALAVTHAGRESVSPWRALLDLQHRSRLATNLPFEAPYDATYQFDRSGSEQSQANHFDEFLRVLASEKEKRLLVVDDAHELADGGPLHAALRRNLPKGVFILLLARTGAPLQWAEGRPENAALEEIDSAEYVEESESMCRVQLVQLSEQWRNGDPTSGVALNANLDVLVKSADGFLAYVEELSAIENPEARRSFIGNPPAGLRGAHARALAEGWRACPTEAVKSAYPETVAVLACLGRPLGGEDVSVLLRHVPPEFLPGALLSGASVLEALEKVALRVRDIQPWMGSALAKVAAGRKDGVAPWQRTAMELGNLIIDAAHDQPELTRFHELLAKACEGRLKLTSPPKSTTSDSYAYALQWGDWHGLRAIPAGEATLDSLDSHLGRLMSADRIDRQWGRPSRTDPWMNRSWRMTARELLRRYSEIEGQAQVSPFGPAAQDRSALVDGALGLLARWQEPLQAGRIDACASAVSLLGSLPGAESLRESWERRAIEVEGRSLRIGNRASEFHLKGSMPALSGSGNWLAAVRDNSAVLWRLIDGVPEREPVHEWSALVDGQSVLQLFCIEHGGEVQIPMLVREKDGTRKLRVLRWAPGINCALPACDAVLPCRQTKMMACCAAKTADGPLLGLVVADSRETWVALVEALRSDSPPIRWHDLPAEDATAVALRWSEVGGEWNVWIASPFGTRHRVRRWKWAPTRPSMPAPDRSASFEYAVEAIAPLGDGTAVVGLGNFDRHVVDARGQVHLLDASASGVRLAASAAGLLALPVHGGQARLTGAAATKPWGPKRGLPRGASAASVDDEGNTAVIAVGSGTDHEALHVVLGDGRAAGPRPPRCLTLAEHSLAVARELQLSVSRFGGAGKGPALVVDLAGIESIAGRALFRPIEVSALAWHPRLPGLFVGDEFGRLLRWRTGGDGKDPQPRVLTHELEPRRIASLAADADAGVWIGVRSVPGDMRDISIGGLFRFSEGGPTNGPRRVDVPCREVTSLAPLRNGELWDGVILGAADGAVFWSDVNDGKCSCIAEGGSACGEVAAVAALLTVEDNNKSAWVVAASRDDRGGNLRMWNGRRIGAQGNWSWTPRLRMSLPFSGQCSVGFIEATDQEGAPGIWLLNGEMLAEVQGVSDSGSSGGTMPLRILPLPAGRVFAMRSAIPAVGKSGPRDADATTRLVEIDCVSPKSLYALPAFEGAPPDAA